MTEEKQILQDIPKGIISWNKFNKEDTVLLLDDKLTIKDFFNTLFIRGEISVFDYFSFQEFTTLSLCEKKYSVIVVMNGIERIQNLEQFLESIKDILMQDGRMFLVTNNRFGIRYFCGDRDPYTGRNFDGIENYRRYMVKKEDYLEGRMYDKEEWKAFISYAGFQTIKTYSVFPSLEEPSFIFSEDYLPNEELSVRVFPMYNSPNTIFLEEEYLYTDLIKLGLFHSMANAFLFECFPNKVTKKNDIEHVTMSIDRGKKDALYTIIRRVGNEKIVEKRSVYSEGRKRIGEIYENCKELKQRGVNVVEMTLNHDILQMPFIKGETAIEYFKRIAHQDKELLISEMDRFYNILASSSDIYEKELEYGKDFTGVGPERNTKHTKHLKKGYIDLVPLNCFVVDGDFVFYDQEFYIEDCPLGVLITRFVDFVYQGDYSLEAVFPRTFFQKRYGIENEVDTYRRIINEFFSHLLKQNELRLFYEKKRRDIDVLYTNRQRINFSDEEYQHKFIDIMNDIGKRKLILFGAGDFAKRFISMYGDTYEIEMILDNNQLRWGKEINGIKIQNPKILAELDKEKYKVMICIKSFLSVSKQIEKMGIMDYGIFDPSKSYIKRNKIIYDDFVKEEEHKLEEKKKYKLGYVAGVFDMFHVGHINLLKKAKEQCEILLVGVLPDEEVYHQKKKYPIISCEDRVEVLKSCRYVDEVKVLPVSYCGIRDSYKMYQFDVMFSGDDHSDDSDWLVEKEYLKKHGSDLVFFNYTDKISSTQIRSQIKNNLN